MNGLPFEQLPAAQVEEIRKQLHGQWQIEANALNRSWFSDRGKFETAKAKLNAKYQQMELNALTQMQRQQEEQQRVQQLIRRGTQGMDREEEAGLRMELGPEAERLVFPEKERPVDWRLEHQRVISERSRLMSLRDMYKLDSKGRLYGVDDAGKIDKSLPATQAEFQGWVQSIQALESLHIYEREQILPNLTTADIAPTRLQELMLEKREASWRREMEEKLWKAAKYLPGVPMAAYHLYGKKRVETPGTFSDKVSGTMGRPVTEPRVKEPEQKITRKQLLTEYRRLGGSRTVEGKAFADRYLR